MIIAEIKKCLSCNTALKGRVDKKFCDDYCRNNHNNRLKQMQGHYALIRQVNNVLIRNRKILASVLPGVQQHAKATRIRLVQLGFEFNYFTHKYTSRGKTWYYCYDHGYMPLGRNWYRIIKRKEE